MLTGRAATLRCAALVIGAGPAGLMAAETLAAAGRGVVVCDAKPTAGRKFLMAGKSGLNLTRDEPLAAFTARYAEAAGWLAPMLAVFGPDAVQHWAQGLGQPVFSGSTGRVFPVAMKASPLLRAWLARLAVLRVEVRPNWRWQGFAGDALAFASPQGAVDVVADVCVLACGGASWARLGADAAWVPWLAGRGVPLAPFQPANVGFGVAWSPHMARLAGQPVKGAALTAGGQRVRGEFVVTARGIEGGGVYALSRVLRSGAALTLDLAPDRTLADVAARLARPHRDSLSNHLRKTLGFDPLRVALVQELARDARHDPARLAVAVKTLPVPLTGPHPMDDAISVAGGVTRAALTDGLELRAVPGMYCCGEMLDWEAPTGGYLLTACMATGRWAGCAAAAR